MKNERLRWVPGVIVRCIFLILAQLYMPELLLAQTSGVVVPPERITVTGSFRFRTETDADTDYATYRNFSSMRIRTDVQFRPEESYRVFFQPQFSKVFGEPVMTPSTATANSSQNTSGTSVDPTFLVHQGYLDYSANDWLKIIVGRQVFSYGDELLIGALDWNNVGRSFDGAKAKYTYDLGWLDMIYTKLVDNNVTTGPSNGDINFSGLYNSLNLADYLKAFDVYYFQKDDDSQFVGKKLFVAGARVASQVSSFDYRAEYTKQWGSIVADSSEAFQYDAELGYRFSDEGWKPRLSVEAFTAGKDFDQLYATAHKWLGYADIFGRKNITGGVAHLSFVPFENLTVQTDYHYFSRYSNEAPAYKVNGSTALGTANGSNSMALGDELDVTLKYKLTKGVGVAGGYSYFMPGDYLKQQFAYKSPEFYYVQAEASF